MDQAAEEAKKSEVQEQMAKIRTMIDKADQIRQAQKDDANKQ